MTLSFSYEKKINKSRRDTAARTKYRTTIRDTGLVAWPEVTRTAEATHQTPSWPGYRNPSPFKYPSQFGHALLSEYFSLLQYP